MIGPCARAQRHWVVALGYKELCWDQILDFGAGDCGRPWPTADHSPRARAGLVTMADGRLFVKARQVAKKNRRIKTKKSNPKRSVSRDLNPCVQNDVS